MQYGTNPTLGLAAPCSPATVGVGDTPVEVTADLSGLQAGTLYYYRVVAVNTEGADPGPEEKTLTTVPAVEYVLTGESTEIGKTTVTLNGTLKPNGVDAHYYFEYGESEAYGSVIPVPPGTDAGIGDLATEEVVLATVHLAGLKANTTYYYRLVASNEFGVTPATEGRSFKTLPVDPRVLSQSATLIFPREALLGAVVVPEESNTTYHFAYGPTAAYGSVAPVGDIELGEGSEGLQALLSVSGLQPGTTYHYAVVARNAGGSTYGPDETFTTPPVCAAGRRDRRGERSLSEQREYLWVGGRGGCPDELRVGSGDGHHVWHADLRGSGVWEGTAGVEVELAGVGRRYDLPLSAGREQYVWHRIWGGSNVRDAGVPDGAVGLAGRRAAGALAGVLPAVDRRRGHGLIGAG